MKILIAKQNEVIIQSLMSKKKFVFISASKNTSTFQISERLFIELRNTIRENGINPYAMMCW